jgi:hypothetical protein
VITSILSRRQARPPEVGDDGAGIGRLAAPSLGFFGLALSRIAGIVIQDVAAAMFYNIGSDKPMKALTLYESIPRRERELNRHVLPFCVA